MKYTIYALVLFIVLFWFTQDIYVSISFVITLSLLFYIIFNSNDSFVFREFALLLYSVNYLFSPSLTYGLGAEMVVIAMKIEREYYFSLAVPGIVLFAIGLYSKKTNIFKPDRFEFIKSIQRQENFIFRMTIFFIIINMLSGVFSGNIEFLIYLVSLLRFVGVNSLFVSAPKKYISLVIVFYVIEFYAGFKSAMFHDSLMWFIFFLLFSVYFIRPNILVKIITLCVFLLFILLIQRFKVDYRESVWRGDQIAGLATVSDVGFKNASSVELMSDENLLGTLNRGNQAWIFASSVDRMDRTLDFQGLNLVQRYFEAALLPRFLLPDKIKSGDRDIFNRFSGHYITQGTAMGLGIFADGYIAFGRWGVYVFLLFFGWLFSIVFFVVDSWSKVSMFYLILILPILNYAIRPDCELQTSINHISKSLILYGIVVTFSKYRFVGHSSTISHIT